MLSQNDYFWAEALVLWLWEETLVQEVLGSNPGTVYWMDIFSSLFVVKNCLFEKTENKQKEARDAYFC